MKRKITELLTFVLTVIFSAFCLVACNRGGETTARLVEEHTSATQIVMTIEKTDGKATAFDALKSLRNQDLISFDYSTSSYGAYITSINGKAEVITESTANSSKGSSWILYTSDMDSAYDTKTIMIGETVCGQSSLGASSLIVKEGVLYVWVYEAYEYTW